MPKADTRQGGEDDGDIFQDAHEEPIGGDAEASTSGQEELSGRGPAVSPVGVHHSEFSNVPIPERNADVPAGTTKDSSGQRKGGLRSKISRVGKKGLESDGSTEFMEGKLAAAYRAPTLQIVDSVAEYSGSGGLAGDVDYSLHRAVFNGDMEQTLALLRGMTQAQKEALDPQGNSALHIAVLRKKPSLVLALLEAGVSPSVQNTRRWTPVEEAVSLRDKELVKLLYARETSLLKAEMKAKKSDLLKSLEDIPDLSFQLKWELGSPVLGMLLRKYAPHDTYQVWKSGTKMRMDGSLMGLDDKRTSLLPQWKRGHFSLLFDGATTPATMLLCDHAKKKYLDLSKEKKAHKPSLDDEAAMIISDGAGRTKMRASEFRFKVVKNWLGSDSTEKIEGWKTRIYEAAGKMMAVTINKSPMKIPEDARYEDYLALQPAEDEVSEVPIDPYSLDVSDRGGKSTGEEGKKKKAKQARRLTGRCWMAEDFPMSLKQLLPLLEVIGNANKHIARVGKFLQKYGDLSLFPVKLQVPIVYTVYALISFRQFKTLDSITNEAAKSDSWYRLPEGYTLKTFDDITAARRQSKRAPSWDGGDLPSNVRGSDKEILAQMGL